MPTRSEPIQFDEMPREYDQSAVQRSVESAVRRVYDALRPLPPAAQPAAQATPDDPLMWVL